MMASTSVQPGGFGIPQIAFDHLEPLVRRKRIAEPERVDHPHPLAEREQLAHQDAADVARPTGDQNHPLPLLALRLHLYLNVTSAVSHRSPQLSRPEYRSGGNLTLLP